jgi:hypothetical protein
MKMVLLRIGIDSGCGGMQGPLFQGCSFEYIPIPDGCGIDERTYGDVVGRHGRLLVEYFPETRQAKMRDQSIHFDPEFETFTYGDPTRPKAKLQRLEQGDMLVFYCGLEGWDFESPPALYLMGYFEVQAAGRASSFSEGELQDLFGKNFHVRHPTVFERDKDNLVLVKGGPGSRLLNKAVLISEVGQNSAGRPLKVLSSKMQGNFGQFSKKNSIQRSPPRWVDPAFVERAVEFVRGLD